MTCRAGAWTRFGAAKGPRFANHGRLESTLLSTLPTMTFGGKSLQDALNDTARDHGPGLYGLVTENGVTVFEGSVGVADMKAPRPINAYDRFRIGSVTKVYTATLVLQLIAEGVLSLYDPVERWLPGLHAGAGRTPPAGMRHRSIRLRHRQHRVRASGRHARLHLCGGTNRGRSCRSRLAERRGYARSVVV
jgi:CubicO group peptidase (beta-lactamase class C family)